MAKGRKAISDSMKKMKGTNQPCRMNNENQLSEFQLLKLPPAKNLGTTGKKIYKATGTILMNHGILNELNLPQFFQYCKECELYLDIMESMPNTSDLIHEVTDKQANTTTKVKALRKIAQDALNNSKSLASDFGLTPSAQAKIIGSLKKENKNPLDEFMNQ